MPPPTSRFNELNSIEQVRPRAESLKAQTDSPSIRHGLGGLEAGANTVHRPTSPARVRSVQLDESRVFVFSFAHVPMPSSCAECGCADVERLGSRRNSNQFLCVEGHKFEVPRQPGFLARWREKRRTGS